MTLSSFLRRFLLPTVLLGTVVAVLTWEPSGESPGWKAQVTSSVSSAVCGNGVREGAEECDCYGEEHQWTCNSTTRYCDCPSPIGNGTCTCVNVLSSSSSAASVDCAPCTNGGCQTCTATENRLCGIPLTGGNYECLVAPNANYTVCTCPEVSSSSSPSSLTSSAASSVLSVQSSATSQQSSAAVSSQVSSASVASLASSSPPLQSSSSARSIANGSVIGLEAGLCAQVKADPITGQKLVYCCLDEGFIYQKEATQQEFEQFVSLLKRLEGLSAKDAKPIFDAPYDGSIHKKYGWTSLCGKQIPCDVCSQDHICGNGVVEATEKCDDGPRNSDETPDVCRLDCTMPKCGDGVIDRQAGEECDDEKFNGNQPNRCRTDCVLPVCGDGIIDSLSGETCDSGRANSNTLANSCRNNCQSPRCGDNVKDSNEDCDDGNRADGDGCSFYCELERRQSSSAVSVSAIRCGNGVMEPGEECDTGSNNANIPDSCRQNCVLPRCGDRIQDAGEECDDGNNANGDGCGAQCTRELVLSLTNVCGNQTIDPGEECDAGKGNANIPDHCRFDCRFPTCGDGIRDTHEQCDDRNHLDGDGCTRDCFSEFCGDGFREMGEECDDGNLISGDGCSRLCQKDTGTPVSALVIQSGSLALRSSRPPLRGAASSQAAQASSKASAAQKQSSAQSAKTAQTVSQASSSLSSTFVIGGQTFSVTSLSSQPAPDSLNAQVIPFPIVDETSVPVPVSTYYYPNQPVFTTASLNDTGPAALSIVAMGAAAGLAWARRRRRV